MLSLVSAGAQRIQSIKWPTWLVQALKFAVVGLSNTAIDACLYFMLTRGLAAPPVPAKAISFAAGVLNSFYWNRSWTFQASGDLASFAISNILALGVNVGGMYVCLQAFNLPEALALALATSLSFVWNFAISKFFVFKK